MASTQDCKNLLDSDPRTAPHVRKGWKRLLKKRAPDGVEHIFTNKEQSFFAWIVEKDGRLENTYDLLPVLNARVSDGSGN